MIIYIDIDNTICYSKNETQYELSTPIEDNIRMANALYDMGHTIVYWTARGTKTGIDWSDITIQQFKLWNVKYHDIIFGKPCYDIFIDDKNINASDFMKFYKEIVNSIEESQ